MPPATSQPAIRLIPLILGIVALTTALFSDQIWSIFGHKPLSDMFTSPRLRRSVRINWLFARFFLTALGLGAFLQGVGGLFLTPDMLDRVAFFFLGISILLVLLMAAVIFRFWSEE